MAKKILTKKQNVIELLLYCFRFLNSKQIQEFLGHRDHRRINSWLKDLSDKEYVVREYTPQFGRITKPALYHLALLGRASIRNGYTYFFPKYLQRIARDTKASKAFRIKCQIIADWYLLLFPIQIKVKENGSESVLEGKENTKKKRDGEKVKETNISILDILIQQLTTDVEENEKAEVIPLNTLQFFTPAYFPSFILLSKIKPDAYLRKRTTKGIRHGLLFVIDAYVPRFLLRYTLQRIFTTLDEEYWDDESILAVQFYLLCPNNQIIIYLKRLLPSFLEGYYGGKLLQFHFATRNQLYRQKKGFADKIQWVKYESKDY